MAKVYSRTTMTLDTWYEVMQVLESEVDGRVVVKEVAEYKTEEEAKEHADRVPEGKRSIVVVHRVIHDVTG